MLAKLWAAIEAGEPLRAELETITCMAIPYAAGQREPESIETFMSAVLVDGAARQKSPDGAALLRLLWRWAPRRRRRRRAGLWPS